LLESRPAGDGSTESRRIGRALAERGMETKKPQDTQIIFRNAHRRIADKADAASCNICQSIDVVVDSAVTGGGQGIDGEVATFGVALPVSPEGNLSAASECLDVFTQRRNLERTACRHDRDGAMLDAGRYRFEACSFHAAHNLGRERGRG